jgi:hypothetical protein
MAGRWALCGASATCDRRLAALVLYTPFYVEYHPQSARGSGGCRPIAAPRWPSSSPYGFVPGGAVGASFSGGAVLGRRADAGLASGWSVPRVVPWRWRPLLCSGGHGRAMGLGAAGDPVDRGRADLVSGSYMRRLFLQRAMILAGVSIMIGVDAFTCATGWTGIPGSAWKRCSNSTCMAWVLLAVALGSILPDCGARSGLSRVGKAVWRSVCVVLAASALLYPLLPSRRGWRNVFPGSGRRVIPDGTAYRRWASTSGAHTGQLWCWPRSERASAWLWENVRGTPVMAWRPWATIARGGLLATSYTGLPTLVGMHAASNAPALAVRCAREMRQPLSYHRFGETQDILARYDVRYILWGPW